MIPARWQKIFHRWLSWLARFQATDTKAACCNRSRADRKLITSQRISIGRSAVMYLLLCDASRSSQIEALVIIIIIVTVQWCEVCAMWRRRSGRAFGDDG